MKPTAKPVEQVRADLVRKGLITPNAEPSKVSRCTVRLKDENGKELGECGNEFTQLARDSWSVCPHHSHPHMFRREQQSE